jgi:hypothetical protein
MDASKLAVIPLFAGLPDADLATIASAALEVQVEAGETRPPRARPVTRCSDPERHRRCHRRRREAGGAGPGRRLGEIAMLAAGHRTASVVATSRMTLIALFNDGVSVLERQPGGCGPIAGARDESPRHAPRPAAIPGRLRGPERLAEAGRWFDDLEDHPECGLGVQVREPPAPSAPKPSPLESTSIPASCGRADHGDRQDARGAERRSSESMESRRSVYGARP